MKINRRSFGIQSVLGTAGLAGVHMTHAQVPMLLESSPQAKALGYKAVASKVDKASFPKYAMGQKCATCQLYKAQDSGAAAGACAIFPGNLVSAEGWCSAFIKKA